MLIIYIYIYKQIGFYKVLQRCNRQGGRGVSHPAQDANKTCTTCIQDEKDARAARCTRKRSKRGKMQAKKMQEPSA